MLTVPAQIFSAPTRAKLIAAARDIPFVCVTFGSSSCPRTTRTPWCFQWAALSSSLTSFPPRSKLLGLALGRAPHQQAPLGAAHGEVDDQREGREDQDSRVHRVDAEGALALLDQVAQAPRRSQALAYARADAR